MMRRGNHHQVVRLAGLQHGVPHRLRVLQGVDEIDLIALLAGETRLRHQHLAAADFAPHQAVVGNVANRLADQVDHQRLGLRALDLHRRDVDLADGDVELHAVVDAAQPPLDVAVGQREPELVLGDTQQDRVVQNAARLVAEDHVLAVHRRDAGHVAGDDVIHEGFRLRTLHADLPLDRDVPHGHVIDQRVVLHHRAAIFRPDVSARMVDAVVDRGAPAAGLVRQMPIGRFADAGGDQHLGRRRTGLAQVDRHQPVGLVDRHALAHLVAGGGLGQSGLGRADGAIHDLCLAGKCRT